MRLKVEVWRQAGPGEPGRFEAHTIDGVEPQLSVLELLDALNERLIDGGQEPVAFDSDCREGICGACGVTVDGAVHGLEDNVPSCHQRLSSFRDGATVRIEPLRSAAFPVLRDLVVGRDALDDLIRAGGHVAVDAGTAPDADAVPTTTDVAEEALDFAVWLNSSPEGVNGLIENSGIGWSANPAHIGTPRQQPSEFFSGQDYNQEIFVPAAKQQNADWSWWPITQQSFNILADGFRRKATGGTLVDAVADAEKKILTAFTNKGLSIRKVSA